MTRRLILTADDFGLALPVNEAVERAHREGVLTTASLLVGAAAAQDAIARARRNTGLRVGLHVAVCEGSSVLPASQLPDLIDPQTGQFHPPLVAAGRMFWVRGIEAQLQAEIAAQFEAFRAARLELDHVNAHNNMQLHPVLLPIVMRLAKQFGVRSLRLPYEPLLPSWRATRSKLAYRALCSLGLAPWSAYVKRRLQCDGFLVNDYLFGMYDCGELELAALLGFVRHLPRGVSEIHCHPATRRCPELDATMPKYRHEGELAALLDPALREALARSDLRLLAGFGELLETTQP
jgi:hopanoid biosynthesis associated protein HpnK